MVNFPLRTDIDYQAAEPAGPFTAAVLGFYDAVLQLPAAALETTLTISVGSVAPIQYAHAIDTEAAAAADDLTHLDPTNIPDGQQVLLHTVDPARVITIKHAATGIGDITLVDGLDFVLDDIDKRLLLERRGNTWKEICRSYANDQVAARAFAGLTIGTDVMSPTGDGSGLTGIVSGATVAEKSQIAQNSFLIYAQNALAGSNTANGWVDVFTDQTGIDAASSLNATYDATNHLYNNGGAGLSGTKTTITSSMISQASITSFNAAQMVDGITNVNNAGYVASNTAAGAAIIINFGSAASFGKWRQYITAAASNGLWRVEYSDNGTTWIATDSVASDLAAGAWHDFTWTNVGAHQYWRLVTTATASGQGWLVELELYAFLSVLDMTLISNASTAISTPISAQIFIWEEDVGAVTPNADLKAYASRDGTTWTQITLAVGTTLATGQLLTGTADISAQPAGTSMKYKIETLNTKELKMHGTQLYWS